VNTPLCPSCPRIRPPVPPSGPTPCRLLFIGECPAESEDRQCTLFAGYTGQELNHTYLSLLGVPRSEIYITSAVLCSRIDYDNPTADEAQVCASVHLGPTLAAMRPQVIAPLGAVACSLFPNVDLNTHHGIPLPGRWGATWEGVLWPMYHPSAGLRQTGYMIPLMRDFYELGVLLRGMTE
jgi:uracil-DNA glycosylase